jgi:hypothetical protein
MKTFPLFLGLAILGAGNLRAADEAAANENTTNPAATAPLVDEKAKSTFSMQASERNPFWPIGWKPAPSKAGTETAGPSISPGVFLVSSIALSQGEHFAIINGKVMKEGDQFGLQMGTQTYQITVKAIEDGQVVLQRRDEEITVPLRRK